eukprot:TRINITY_DN51489_c0_g1_i1.p1 TRINITY_DN51489_c0_g1~~TRINITY_DN51489_c0_g1_i1.p1  ORF type:complete len:294 (-),score=52.88 TRINITY_DN51489_c0_g1_i1:293-1174(-)
MPEQRQLGFAEQVGSAAVAACTAEVFTIPIDTAKVRLQLQKTTPGATPMYSGMLGTMGTIARNEGVAALWKGIVPGLHRQCLFGGLRIGMYEPIKQLYCGKDQVGPVGLHLKVAAAVTTGGVAMAIASPTDFVKVRMQSEGQLAEGAQRKYRSALGAYKTIAQQEGVAALWTGVGPNIARNSIMNAAELATYDEFKERLQRTGLFADGTPLHLTSALAAGFVAVCVGSPLDVIKSRMMGDTTGQFKGPMDCVLTTLRNEGVSAFYKGFVPNYGRVGSWNVVMFLTLEKVRSLM